MSNLNKTCVICGNKYSYCPSCGKDRNKPSWMASFCSENCRDVYDVVARYGMNKIHSAEAVEILNTCDLSNKERFTASTQRLIDEIYAFPKEICTESLLCPVTESEVISDPNDDNVVVCIADEEMHNTEPEIAPENVCVAPAHTVARKINYKKKKKNR